MSRVHYNPDLHNDTYDLTITWGGLLYYMMQEVAEELQASQNLTNLPDDRMIGERIEPIRQSLCEQYPDDRRHITEACKRVACFTPVEVRTFTNSQLPPDQRRILAWIAVCRRYSFMAAFAETVKETFLLDQCMTKETWEQFYRRQTLWHDELTELSETTVNKLRQNMLRIARDAGFIGHANSVRGTYIPTQLEKLLNQHPESYNWLPTRKGGVK